jgi:hypothetical protein
MFQYPCFQRYFKCVRVTRLFKRRNTLTDVLVHEIVWVDESFYLVILLLTKVTILIFYLRIFPRRWFQVSAKLILVFVVLSGVVILLLQILQCLPVAYNWDKTISGAKCLNVNALTYTHAGITITQDLLILVLPLPELASLQLERNKKIGVILMFQVGALYVRPASSLPNSCLHDNTAHASHRWSDCVS